MGASAADSLIEQDFLVGLIFWKIYNLHK